MLEGLAVSRIAEARTVRLVSTARLREPVLKGLVPEEQLDALAEIEGATSGRLLAQQHGAGQVHAREFMYGVPCAAYINAAFAYSRPRGLNRFNGPERGAWYAALEVETSLAEVAFHLTRELEAVGRFEAVVDYAELYASFAGEFVDLRQGRHPCLDPDPAYAYPLGNAVADSARAVGLNGIIYPSVRRAEGTCLVALSPHAVQSVAEGGVWRLRWSGSPEPRAEPLTG